MATPLEIGVLGELEIRRDGELAPLPPSKKARALLAYLVLSGRAQRRERLSHLLWDVADDPRGALRWSLSRIRPLVNETGVVRIIADRESVGFAPEGAAIDLEEVRAVVDGDPSGVTTDRLVAMAARFRGELLEGLDLADFDDFQSWLVALREEARRLRASLAERLLGALGDGDPEAAIPHARTLVRLDPLDEARRARLVGLLARAGRLPEATQQLDAAKRALAEIGRTPGPVLIDARRQLTAAPPAEAPPTPEPAPAGGGVLHLDLGGGEVPGHTLLGGSPLMRTTVHGLDLFGRDEERGRISDLLDRVATDRRAQVLLFSGEPGIGKSRLLVEAVTQTRRRRGTVLDGAAFEAEARRPYGPWVDLLRRLPPGTIEAGVGADLGPLLPELGSTAAPSASSEAPDVARERLFQTIGALLAERANRRPPALVALDDVQWFDAASCALLHYLVRASADLPVLFVLTARRAEIADNAPLLQVLRRLRRGRTLEEHLVGPLEPGDTAALIGAADPDLDAPALGAEAAGNPLFALELVRAGGDLTGGSVSSVVRHRVDGLGPDAAALLRWASVLGQSFALSLLEPLCGLDPDELVEALEELELHALVEGVVDTRDPGGRYRFAHEIVRRVVYADLSSLRRKVMHRRVAERLAGADAKEADAAGIAHHALAAGDAALAVSACVRAARRCVDVFAHADAVSLIRRGLQCAESLPEPDRIRRIIELEELSYLARVPDDHHAAASRLEELAEQALDLGAPAHAQRGYHVAAWLRWERGDLSRSPAGIWKAEHASRSADPAARATAMAEAARCLVLLQRDLPKAEAWLNEAEALGARNGSRPQAIPDTKGLLDAHRGAYDDAARFFEEARNAARDAGNHRTELLALANLASLEVERGRVDDACGWARALTDLADRVSSGSEGPFGRALGALCAVRRAEGGADGQLDEALGTLRGMDAKQRLFFVLTAAAEDDVATGRIEAAQARADEAVALAQTLDRDSDLAVARALRGLCAVYRNDSDVVQATEAALEEGNDHHWSARASRLVTAFRAAAAAGTTVAALDLGAPPS